MKESVTIRKAVPADAGPIHELHLRSVRQLCSAVYSPETIEGWLANRTPQGYLPGINRGEMYVAESEGRMVGFGHAVPGEIWAIYVDPAYVRRGIGSLLLEHGLEMAKANTLGPVKVESTLNARLLYEKNGFKFKRDTVAIRNNVTIPSVELYLEI